MADSRSGSNIDNYGFTLPDDYDFKTYDEFMSKYLEIMSHRSIRWTTFLNENVPNKTSRKLKRFIRKGIPPEHRPSMWMDVSGAEERRQQNPNLYKELLAGPHDQQLVEVIKNDIHRTFPDNIYFREESGGDPNCKRGPLFNVLVAVSHKNEATGYCQGMNFITGLLLLVMKDEEKVFWLIDTLLNAILPDYYTPDMIGIKMDCEVLGELARMKCPDIHLLMEKCGCPWSIVATKWLICLFVDVLPVETVLRLWDCMFFEGDKVLFRVCITLIRRHHAQLARCTNFSELMEAFRMMTSDSVTLDCHQFIDSIFKEPGSFSRSLLLKLREECRRRVIQES